MESAARGHVARADVRRQHGTHAAQQKPCRRCWPAHLAAAGGAESRGQDENFESRDLGRAACACRAFSACSLCAAAFGSSSFMRDSLLKSFVANIILWKPFVKDASRGGSFPMVPCMPFASGAFGGGGGGLGDSGDAERTTPPCCCGL